jgi:hypothetical protein
MLSEAFWTRPEFPEENREDPVTGAKNRLVRDKPLKKELKNVKKRWK